jgi:hypothetical protein
MHDIFRDMDLSEGYMYCSSNLIYYSVYHKNMEVIIVRGALNILSSHILYTWLPQKKNCTHGSSYIYYEVY